MYPDTLDIINASRSSLAHSTPKVILTWQTTPADHVLAALGLSLTGVALGLRRDGNMANTIGRETMLQGLLSNFPLLERGAGRYTDVE